MSEIHPAIKLVIPEIIRRLFKGGVILLGSRISDLPLGSSGLKTAVCFKL